MRPVALFVAAAVVWTLLASTLYAWLGIVPFHCWFYYAVPWPADFLWSGLFLIVSGALAALPFFLARWMYRQLYERAPRVYGETRWADRADMTGGGISSTKSP